MGLACLPLILSGVPGTLVSPLAATASFACVDNLDGTLEPEIYQRI